MVTQLLVRPQTRNGFTLIELLVVMTIVALLLTLALPRYYGSIETSKQTVLRENLQVVRATIDKFYADRGRYPDSLDELVSAQYLRAVPIDPITESANTWVLIAPSEGERRGVADVRSGATGATVSGLTYDQL